MPLEFQSLSHGPIAFGFFNVETDLLLLERYFLFAREFCEYISELAKEGNGSQEKAWGVYRIERRGDIGDLMGAIHGIRSVGFIGEVYQLFPFPLKPEDFKQKPGGGKNRATVEGLIQKHAPLITIPVKVDHHKGSVSIAEYLFSRDSFRELINYVWRGGYPRWKDEVKPDYVLKMKEAIERSGKFLFQNLVLNGSS